MKQPPRSLLVVAAVLIVAVLVRAWGLGLQSFSMDEAGVFRDLASTYAALIELPDSFPPLYVMLLKWWNGIYPGEVGARWLSVAFGLVGVMAIWAAGREVGDERTGLVAAALLAVSAFHVFYSQAVRPYSMYFALAAVALYCFIRAVRHDDLWAWLGFALACVLGVFTHYYFVLLVAASFVALLLARGNDAVTIESLGCYLTITALALAALPLLKTDLAYQTSIRPPRTLGVAEFGYTFYAMISGFSLGPSKADIYSMGAVEATRRAAPWIGAMAVLLVAPVVMGIRALSGRRAWMLAALVLLPILAAGVLGYTLGVTYNVRFVNWCLVPAILWIAAGVTHESAGVTTRLSVLGLVVLQLAALNNRNTVPHYQTEDMRSVAGYLAAQPERAPIFVCSDYMAKPLRHYMKDPWVIRGLPDESIASAVIGDEEQAAAAVRQLAGLVGRPGTFWFVYTRRFHGDPDGHLLRALSESTDFVIEREFAGATLYRGTLASRLSARWWP